MINSDDPKMASDFRTLKKLVPQYLGQEDIRDHYGDVSKWVWLLISCLVHIKTMLELV